MPSQAYFDQQHAIASAKSSVLDAMHATGEKDLAIWIAVFAELLKFVSDANLQHERGEADDEQER